MAGDDNEPTNSSHADGTAPIRSRQHRVRSADMELVTPNGRD